MIQIHSMIRLAALASAIVASPAAAQESIPDGYKEYLKTIHPKMTAAVLSVEQWKYVHEYMKTNGITDFDTARRQVGPKLLEVDRKAIEAKRSRSKEEERKQKRQNWIKALRSPKARWNDNRLEVCVPPGAKLECDVFLADCGPLAQPERFFVKFRPGGWNPRKNKLAPEGGSPWFEISNRNGRAIRNHPVYENESPSDHWVAVHMSFRDKLGWRKDYAERVLGKDKWYSDFEIGGTFVVQFNDDGSEKAYPKPTYPEDLTTSHGQPTVDEFRAWLSYESEPSEIHFSRRHIGVEKLTDGLLFRARPNGLDFHHTDTPPIRVMLRLQPRQ